MGAIVSLFVGGIALLFGVVVSVALLGLGICGSEVTIGGTVVSMAFAAVSALIGFVATPSMRALGASMFSLPLAFAIVFLAVEHDWLRCLSVLVCIITAGVTVWALAKGQSPKMPDGF